MNALFPIETHALTKRFGSTLALDALDWRLPAGSVVGLLGRNGSGKSTLLQTALGLLLPTSGTVQTLGRSAAELTQHELARIGFVDQDASLLEWLTVEQHLRYVAALQPRWDTDLERRLVSEFELDRSQRIARLSKGMRQRLAILVATCHRPALLLLDEPVSALDPLARAQVLQFLLELVRDDGTTVVVSSHVLSDVEQVVDRVLCLQAGRVVEDTSLDALKEAFAEWIVTSPADLPPVFDENYVLERTGNGRRVRLAVRCGESELDRFRARYGVAVERRHLGLERIFPYLTTPAAQGSPARDASGAGEDRR